MIRSIREIRLFFHWSADLCRARIAYTYPDAIEHRDQACNKEDADSADRADFARIALVLSWPWIARQRKKGLAFFRQRLGFLFASCTKTRKRLLSSPMQARGIPSISVLLRIGDGVQQAPSATVL